MKLKFDRPINIQENDVDKFITSTDRNINCKVPLVLNNVLIFPNGSVSKNLLLNDISLPYPYEIFKKNYSLIIKIFIKSVYYYFKYDKIKVNKSYLIITDMWSANYFHWFTECLPRLLNAKSELPNDITILLPSSYKNISYIESSLKILDVTYEHIKNDYSIYKIKQLYAAPHIITSGHHEPVLMKQLKNIFIEKTAFASTMKKNRVYISRKYAKIRKIINEEEIIKILMKYNFEILYMEKYSWDEQVEIMKNVEILVGAHGAGMTNMLFAEKNITVFEILPRRKNNTINNCYYSLSSSLNYKYFYQFASSQKKAYPKDDGGDSNVIVDPIIFEKTLNDIINDLAEEANK